MTGSLHHINMSKDHVVTLLNGMETRRHGEFTKRESLINPNTQFPAFQVCLLRLINTGTQEMTFKNRPRLTEQKNEELRRHTWNQINNQHEGETGSQGVKTHTDRSIILIHVQPVNHYHKR